MISFFIYHFYFYASSLSLINIRISNIKFETCDVQNQIKRIKIENLKTIISLPRTHIRLDDLYKFSTF